MVCVLLSPIYIPKLTYFSIILPMQWTAMDKIKVHHKTFFLHIAFKANQKAKLITMRLEMPAGHVLLFGSEKQFFNIVIFNYAIFSAAS